MNALKLITVTVGLRKMEKTGRLRRCKGVALTRNPGEIEVIDRREFLLQTAALPLALSRPVALPDRITLFLGGDVMTGRGIDQVLPHPSNPRLFEPYVNSASRYVELAEERHSPLPRRVEYSYVWGDFLDELDRVKPAARIVNLETSVTTADSPWPEKGIHYRMHPRNVPCLTAAGIGCCVLANNHVLDWGPGGLAETLETLRGARIQTAGAGRDQTEARAPAVLNAGADVRVLVFAFGAASSGIPAEWAAAERGAGVNFLPDLSQQTLLRVAEQVLGAKRERDVVVASIHWGGNWGYDVLREQREFAHGLIDNACVDVVHGHSSHHVKGIEVYRGRPIFYGGGDFLNDYEGIPGYEQFRGDLVLAYFPTLDPSDGRLVGLQMTPFQIRRFRLNRASARDADWIRRTVSRESEKFGSSVEAGPDGTFMLRWV